MATTGVAVVTGAGSGLGRSITRRLLAAGWQVAAAGRRWAELQETVATAPAAGAALPVLTDVTVPDSVAALFDRARQQFGPGRRAVQQRGPGAAAALEDIPLADWQSVVDVNLTGDVPVHPGRVPGDEGARSPRGPDHQQRVDLRALAPAAPARLHRDQARGHRPDQVDLAGRPGVRHRLRPDRHRERRDRAGQAARGRGAAAGRQHARRADR